MTEGWLVILVAGTWLSIGVVLALVMGRRGHGAWGWLVLGAVMGPFAIALALDAGRHHEALHETVAQGTTWGGGSVDVVVGVDGSPEADAAAVGVIALFGSRLGRVTLAAVVPYDSGREVEAQARANVKRAGRHFERGTASLEVLSGPPAEALVRLANEGGYDLVAIGARGRGRSKALLGSAATRLARGSKVPVLIFGGDTAG